MEAVRARSRKKKAAKELKENKDDVGEHFKDEEVELPPNQGEGDNEESSDATTGFQDRTVRAGIDTSVEGEAIANADVTNRGESAEASAPMWEEGATNEAVEASAPSAPVGYDELAREVREMEPHLLLQRDLQTMNISEESAVPSAPVMCGAPASTDATTELSAAVSHASAVQANLAPVQAFTESQLRGMFRPTQLTHIETFVDAFLASEQHVDRSELHQLTLNYMRTRIALAACEKKIESARDEAEQLKQKLWSFHKRRVQGEGECEDKKRVTASQQYEEAEFSAANLSALQKNMKETKDVLLETHSLHAYKSEVCRLKVEDYIFGVITKRCGDREELKRSISVLFSFQRRLVNDERFLTDLRHWLDQLVSVLLSNATLSCHLFLLNHIMRCPAGVGKWAARYIQPRSPVVGETQIEQGFDNPYLDHLLTMLATVLLPVRQREEFLKELLVVASPSKLAHREDNVWVVLDSEGEEDEDPQRSWSLLRESDLVVILAQIPIDAIFRYVLGVERRDGRDVYDPATASEHAFVKLFAFATHFVYLLREGLRTFNTPRFRQFARRLGRLIRHTVQYVSDHWEAFKEQRMAHLDPSMHQRIQVEYDHFFLRATKCIFSAQRLGAWQYLAVIPYGTISLQMLWRIFYVLHLDYREGSHGDFGENIKDWRSVFQDPDLRIQFEEKLADKDDSESYFLLAAFAKMACSRDVTSERDFIEQAGLDIFHAGFVNDETAETSSKSARDMLVTIASKHPSMMSFIIHLFKDESVVAAVGTRSFYLVKDLPFNLWRPNAGDLDLLLGWLCGNPLTATRSQLSRIVLSKMSWHVPADEADAQLVPFRMHQQTALAIVDAGIRLAPDSISEGFLEESMRQMSSLASAIVRQSPEQLFTMWAWETVSKLHLHAVDRSFKVRRMAVEGQAEAFAGMLDFDLDDRVEPVTRGVAAKNPLAAFVALQATQVGQSVPEIFNRGFGFLKIVAASGRFDHVMECLLNITPLFLHCPEGLTESDKFMAVMQSVLAADQTVIKMAKDFIITDFPGPVMKEFGIMLLKELSAWKSYGISDSTPVIHLWLTVITSLPNWSKDRNALYVADILCKEAFERNAAHIPKNILNKIYQDAESKSSSGGFFSWLSNGKSSDSLLPASAWDFAWFSYFVLEVEDERDVSAHLWDAIVAEFSDDNVTLEQAIKSASLKLSLPVPNPNRLSLYRWSQIVIDLPVGHPLLPIFAQKFFNFYLRRPLPGKDGHEHGSVGVKFFVGLVNRMYLNKLRSKLSSAHEFYSSSESVSQKLVIFFNAVSKWLEEDSIVLSSSLHLASLAPMYMPDKLADAIAGSKAIWKDLLDFDSISVESDKLVSEWNNLHFRKAPPAAAVASLEDSDPPAARIVKRLASYDKSQPPPSITLLKPPLAKTSIADDANMTVEALRHVIAPHLQCIEHYTQQFTVNSLELGSLACTYFELVPDLYDNVETTITARVACAGTLGPNKEKFACSGTAQIVLKFKEARKQDNVSYKIKQNRDDYHGLVQRLLQPFPSDVAAAIADLEASLERLLRLYSRSLGKSNGHSEAKMYRDLAVCLYYSLADLLSEEVSNCPPLRHFFSANLEVLGQSIIADQGDQCLRLLERILQRPTLFQFLMPAFTPNVVDGPTFLKVYQTIGEIPDSENTLAFVLLSKVSVGGWLLRCIPKLNERSRLISLIGRSLKKTGANPAESRSMIHGLHRKHLMTLVTCDFPEHFGEVVAMLLMLTEQQSVDPELWFDLINAVIADEGKCRGDSAEWKDVFRNFASKQTLFRLEEVCASCQQLTRHFGRERRQVGLHGLFSKYRSYSLELAAFMSMLGHLTVMLNLKQDRGTCSDQLVSQLWQDTQNLFEAWLCPLSGAERQETAVWIQNMTDSQQVLLPWAPGDAKQAAVVFASFVQVVGFLEEAVPATRNVMGHVWSFYARSFAHPAVKDYVLAVVHNALLALPWSEFAPNEAEVEAMVRIIDTFLPVCHVFIGRIFVEIPWCHLAQQRKDSNLADIKFLSGVLRLVVKLAAEPQLRQIGRLQSLVNEASASLPLWRVDAATYETLMQWYVMSVDCKVALNHAERHQLDAAVLRLLQLAAGQLHRLNEGDPMPAVECFREYPDVCKKRIVFVRCFVRLVTSCGSKQKNFLAANQEELRKTLVKLLENVELVNLEAVPADFRLAEISPLVRELFPLVNASASSILPTVAVDVMAHWCSSHTAQSPMLTAILQLIGSSVNSAANVSNLLEAALEAFFCDVEDDEGQPTGQGQLTPGADAWLPVLQMTSLPQEANRTRDVLDHAVQHGHGLVLYLYLRKRRPTCLSLKEESVLISSVLDWLRHFKLSEKSEPKLSLLYAMFFQLCQRQLDFGGQEPAVVKHLVDFLEVITPLAREAGWNLLGVIGLVSQYHLSPRARFLALSLAVFVRAQIGEDFKLRLRISASNDSDPVETVSDRRLASSESVREELQALKLQKSYLGLSELIDWVLETTTDKDNDFRTVLDFIAYLVTDRLYVERYLRVFDR